MSRKNGHVSLIQKSINENRSYKFNNYIMGLATRNCMLDDCIQHGMMVNFL